MKEKLEQLYLVQNLRISEVAKILGWSNTKTFRMLKKFSIEKSIEETSNRRKQTNLKKYGSTTPAGNKFVYDKMRKTCLERYGVDNNSKRTEVKEASRKRMKEAWTTGQQREKTEKTLLEKYGVDNFAKSKEWQELCRQKIPQNKRYQTMKSNNSFTISKPEEQAYQLLVEKFGSEDVLRQHKTKEYPFNCDFYIKSLNLYLEYQGNWTHGNHPFAEIDPSDKEKLQKWVQKDLELGSTTKKKRNYYTTAIHRWTVEDPLKRKTARENNLNWIEFFSLKDLQQWLNSLT